MLTFVLICLICVLPTSICIHPIEKCTDDQDQLCEHNTALDYAKESSNLQQFLEHTLTLDTRTLQEFPVQRDGGIVIINIAKEIGTNQSEIFGLELLGSDRLTEIDKFIDKNAETANIRILRHWLDRRGSLKEPITFRTLISALRKIGLAKVADEMTATCETFKVMDVHHVPSSVKEYSQQLSLKFEQQFVIDKTQWLPNRLRKKNITFVDLELKEEGRNISLFDILGVLQSGARILFVGRPGVGKTTITRYLSKQLIHSEQFNLVIKLHLGLTGTLDSLNSILQVNADESFDPSDRDIVANYINKKVGEGICFLLDGLDEYDYKGSNYVTSLIQGNKLAKSVVIVTSRPSAIEDYEISFHRKAEIIGFGEKGIQAYLDQLQLSSSEYQTIHQYLSIHPNIRQLCYLPLHLSMLAYIAIDNIGSLSVVDTETKLYTSFLYLTLKQYEFVRHEQTVESLEECFNDLYKESKLCVLLRIISRNAFEGLIDNEQTFTSLSFTGPGLSNISQEIEALSLLRIESFYDTCGHKLKKYYFSHPTFQEFFTAFHLVTLPREEQLSYIKLHWMHEVYKFFVGLIGSEFKFDDEIVCQTFIKFAMEDLATYQDQELYIIKCAHEVGRIPQFTNYLQAVHVITDGNSMHVRSWYDHDCWYIGYTLSQSFLYELTVDKHSELPSCISVISNYLKHDHKTLGRINVTKLTLGSPSNYWPWFTDRESDISTVGEMLDFLPGFQNYLTQLNLLFIKFEHSASILRLGKILKSFSKLKYLSLSVNVSIIEGGHLESALEDLVQLEYLELGVINKYDDDTAISENLLEFKNLKQLQSLKLFISWNKDLVDVNMTSLIGGLVHLTELKSLTIQITLYMGFRDNGAFELIEGIEKNSGINDLALHLDLCWELGLGNVTTEHLVAALKNLTMILKKLSLCIDFNLSGIKGSNGVLNLANGLKDLTELQELDLELRWELLTNDDIDGATKALVDGIKHLQNLKALTLNLEQNGSCSQLALLFKSLNELRELTLTLRCNERTDVIHELKHLKDLRKLIMSWNNFDDEIMVPLTEALKQMKHLHTLDLSNNKIGDTGLKLLAEVIDSSYLNHLQVLLLNFNEFTELGAKDLSTKIIKLSDLYTLKFDSQPLGSYSAQALAQIIIRNKTLTFSRTESSDQYCDVIVSQITILLCFSTAVGGFLCFIFFNSSSVLTSKVHQAWPHKGISEKLAQGIFSTSSAWKLERLKKHGLDGSGTVIVILDTAIDFHCPAFLQKNILYIDCLPQVPNTSNEHGSVCAAVAVGYSYCTASSITVPSGVAPGAQLIVYRIAEGDYCYNEAVVAALDDIKRKVESGTQIDVVSISYDLCEDNREEIHRKIKSLTEKGVVFVAAAGNRGRYQARASIPACFDCVISVGALDKNGYRSRFNACGRIDVFAPGEDIPGPLSSSILFWGTSFATPAITGLVSLLKQCANEVGPPARENIHRVKVLRRILSEHMTVRSDNGQVDILDPVGFFLNVKDKPNLLNEIIQQHMDVEDMEQ